MRKLCSVNVKAMLLRVNLGHIAASDKAVSSSKQRFRPVFARKILHTISVLRVMSCG